MIKLNGGLATTMGLQQPKSLMEARDGKSFLDIIIGQTLALRRRHGVELPLVLMDSDSTREPTLEELARHPELSRDGIEPDFMQSVVPKLDADDARAGELARGAGAGVEPARSRRRVRRAAALGHARRAAGARVSLRDDLQRRQPRAPASTPRIAAHVADNEIPFLMEVAQGTEADRKGGHVARRIADGRLVLRETAQTPDEDQESFRDYRKWRWYNTNTLWVDLQALAERLEQSEGVLELPLIINRKTVDPRDPDSTPVIQLESAMGAAIGSFPGAALLHVPRTRFAPVKTTDDLLVLRSDVYEVGDDLRVEPVPERADNLPFVELDKRYYRLIDAFEQRFPAGAPSLREAERLVVHGDVTFGAGVRVRGAVELDADAPTTIDPDTVLEP